MQFLCECECMFAFVNSYCLIACCSDMFNLNFLWFIYCHCITISSNNIIGTTASIVKKMIDFDNIPFTVSPIEKVECQFGINHYG